MMPGGLCYCFGVMYAGTVCHCEDFGGGYYIIYRVVAVIIEAKIVFYTVGGAVFGGL